MSECKIGDVTVVDQGDVGVAFFVDGDQRCFVNDRGAEELMRWLADKLGYQIVDPHE